jgi:hypothetical protein
MLWLAFSYLLIEACRDSKNLSEASVAIKRVPPRKLNPDY